MALDNKSLYESDAVVGKYATNSTRTRSLNNAEKNFIDQFDIKNKKVLVVGCGIGRVPANLLLYGNTVIGVDRSQGMIAQALKNFPPEKFTNLSFILADATDLSKIPDASFDVVFFPMNAIDYINPYELRETALREAGKKVKQGGMLAFTSHNKLAYIFSPKASWRDKKIKNFFDTHRFDTEHVTGGGYIFKGNPSFVISETVRITGFTYTGFTCDTRSKIDRLVARRLTFAQFFFPYILYIFQKP